MTFSLRRLTTTIIIILLIGVSAFVTAVVSSFDLNNFRAELSDEISSRISQPVDLGKAHFSIKHGPSFAFDQILMGSKDGSFYLTAEHIFFRLEALPLITGKFKFSEILFEEPTLVVKIGQQGTDDNQRKRLFVDQSLIDGDMVRGLRIKHGNFTIEDYRGRQTPLTIGLADLDLVVDDLSLRQSGWIEADADIICNNIKSPFQLKGYVHAGESTPFWDNARYELELQARDFASDVISQQYRKALAGFQIYGRSNIKAKLNGSPASSLDFDLRLSGRDLGLLLPGAEDAIVANTFSANGTWQHKDRKYRVSDLALQFGPLALSGDTQLDLSEETPQLDATVTVPEIKLADLDRLLLKNLFLKDHPEIAFAAGSLSLEQLHIAGPLSLLTGPKAVSAIKSLQLSVEQGEIHFGESKTLRAGRFGIDWDNDTLKLEHLSFNLDSLRLEAESALKIDIVEESDRLRVSGRSGLNVNYLFSPDDPAKQLLPEDGLRVSLFTDAVYNSGRLTLTDNLIALPSIKTIVQGEWDRADDERFSLDLDIQEFPLHELPLISPAVRKIEPDGMLAAAIRIDGDSNSTPRINGSLQLKDVHANLPRPIADINELSGTLNLEWPFLGGNNLSAKLGQSPINLDLDIPDLHKARIDMIITGKEVRSDELIFRSEKTFLRDVDAVISFVDNTLLLGPIHTRMDGGTDVTINGTVTNFPVPDTELTIEGAYGNIDEVIGLWISEEGRSGHRVKKKRGHLEIDVKTDAGEIHHLPFEQGEAHISFRDPALVIYPLTFKSGPGFGTGQVLVEFRDNEPPLLRMSGHLEDFSALDVYQQLLQRKGIVTGSLRGDFYLEGSAGALNEVFLPDSFGAFNFEIKNGNLKKMRALSEVLTIFNIYPIFTSGGQERGVPFKTLSSNVSMENGVLSTEDMVMSGDVMNMSMAGTQNLITNTVDLEMGLMPLRTIDRLVTKIPLAGWILTGKDKSLVTAHFKLTGSADDPEIKAIPIESASRQVVGIFKRLFTLPVKVISDVGKAIE
ncbi:MAG: hypothetical protein C0615_00240 [Desulfuromonas sp.]|nr:MAG: hypothetical protein C0615_00240 [Desulfuromonas sp.]